RFLRPDLQTLGDPFSMLGMRQAVDRLLAARAAGETVAVYGDFDVDGITGTAVLVQALGWAGIRVIPYIPDRQSEGSGFHASAVSSLAAQDVRVVLTVDCGITSAAEVDAVTATGVEVIITDHHCPPDVLPRAVAIVDPRQPGCHYPCKDLAGVGVAFRLAAAVLRSTIDDAPRRERELLDLVAIGTIADMVPLRDENRVLVWYGVRILNETSRLGLQALVARSGLRLGHITATDVGYRICPRLNAAGRLDHASLGYMVLMADTYEVADACAQRLEEKNAERQQLTQQVLVAAHEQLASRPAMACERLLVLHIEPWASGVTGLLAGKLVEETGKPVLVLQECAGEARGSLRGTPAFDVLEALRANADLLEHFGGHRLAAGFATSPERVALLTERLCHRAAVSLDASDVLPTLEIDAEVLLRQLTWQLYDQLQALEPCGVGNPLPLFLCRHLKVLDFRRVGNNHLRLTVGRGSHRMPAIVFRRGDLAPYLRRTMSVDLVFYLEANDWNGNRSLQLRVRDMAFEPAFELDPALDPHVQSR
ncbi:MAG TPA: single-stranded-DNA-specific exonuclease RecJ, partial [Chloroflexota bacterium]|nr:single-stranded-DNA-specific exonuclease RecJ [Chloroflexota bacterium]